LSRTLPSGAVAAPNILSKTKHSQFKRLSNEEMDQKLRFSSRELNKNESKCIMVVDDNKMN